MRISVKTQIKKLLLPQKNKEKMKQFFLLKHSFKYRIDRAQKRMSIIKIKFRLRILKKLINEISVENFLIRNLFTPPTNQKLSKHQLVVLMIKRFYTIIDLN